MNEQDKQRAREFLADPEMGFPLCTGMGMFHPGEPYKFQVDKLAAAFAAVRREGFRSALEKVADNFSEQYKRGDINVTEVQAFLDTRIAHYPEASAAIRGGR